MGKFLDVSAQNSAPRSVFIGDSGTKLFYFGVGGTDTIYRYTLSTAWDVSTGSFDTGQSLASGTASTGRMQIYANPAGTKLYVVDNGADTVRQWTFNTAWDLTDVTFDGTFDVSTQEAGPYSLSFNPTGTKMYVAGAVNSTVYEYDITTAWDITGTVTYSTNSKDISAQIGANPNALYFEDGTADHFVVCNYSDVYRYTMSTAFDVSTAAFDTGQQFTFNLIAGLNTTYGMTFKGDGTEMYLASDTNPEAIYQYTLDTAWDVTTAHFDPLPVADGGVTITPSVLATAKGTLHIDAGVSITPEIAATAVNETNHAAGEVRTPLQVAAVAHGSPHADVAVSITPTITGAATAIAVMAGDATFPSLTATGGLTSTLPSNATLPALTSEATAVAGTAITGAWTLPAFTSEAANGNDANATLPSLTTSAAMLSSSVYIGEAIIPAFIASSAFGDDREISGDVTLPMLVPRGTLATGSMLSGSASIHKITSFGVNAPGTVLTGDIDLPAFNIDDLTNTLVSAGLLTGDATLPLLESQGFFILATLTHTGWAFNTESLRASEYDNYDYVLLRKVFGKYIGVSLTGGVFELAGDTDNAAAINSDVLFGLDSFRTEDLKRVKAVHLGYRADGDGDINVQVVVDGEAAAREYPVGHTSSANGIKRGRATIAKGLKSRYWGYGVTNVAGADFMLDDMSVFVQQHNRKVQ